MVNVGLKPLFIPTLSLADLFNRINFAFFEKKTPIVIFFALKMEKLGRGCPPFFGVFGF